MKRLTSLDEVDLIIKEAASLEDEPRRVDKLLEYYFDPDISTSLDPFSREYEDEMMALYRSISGFDDYRPAQSERTPYLTDDRVNYIRNAPPFGTGSSLAVADVLISIGFIIRTLALKPDAKVIEFGPGSGHLAITLARDGFGVTAVDIEPNYLDIINGQCDALGIPITTFCGEFGQTPQPEQRYDAVLFFESFHHAFHHNRLLRQLQDVTSETGVIAMAGEPIIEAGNYWEPSIPLAWGPRCDLLSVSAMRNYGWMELGFRESYFFEAMQRAGWSASKHECALTPRGNTYLARRTPPPTPAPIEPVAPETVVTVPEPVLPAPDPAAPTLWNRLWRRLV